MRRIWICICVCLVVVVDKEQRMMFVHVDTKLIDVYQNLKVGFWTLFLFTVTTRAISDLIERNMKQSIAWDILCCSTLSSLSYCHYGSSPCLAYLSSNCNSCKDFWTWNGVCFDSCHSSFLHHVVRQILRCCGWKWKILISHDWFQNVGRKHFTRNIRWKLYKIILTLSLQFWWCRFRWLIIFTPWDSFLKNYYMHNDCLLKLIFKKYNTLFFIITNRIKKQWVTVLMVDIFF